MIVLTDCPRELAGLGLAEAAPLAASALPPGQAALWRALGGREALWRAVAPGPGGEAFWALLMATARAERSQFDVLRGMLSDGRIDLPGPVATLALAGDGFHGHHGRSWATAPGNLHLCAAVRPSAGAEPAARDALALTALPAVAVVDALRSPALGSLPAGVKWVNDILVDGAKIAGVLSSAQTVADGVASAVFGIGLNVVVAPDVPPTPFVPAVTSLAARGTNAGLAEAAAEVLAALGERWRALAADGPRGLLDAYRAASVALGRSVAVWPEGIDEASPPDRWPAPLARGVVTAVGDDLALRLAAAPDAGALPASAAGGASGPDGGPAGVTVAQGRLTFEPAAGGSASRAFVTYCSARKRPDPGLLPARWRYDSERIREVERRAAAEGAPLLILSGRFGLLAGEEQVPWYDHLLVEGEVPDLAARVAAGFRALGVREVVWFSVGAPQDPRLAPYERAIRLAAAQARVALIGVAMGGFAD